MIPARAQDPGHRPDAWQALGIAPGCVLRIFGMRRSGNHAIINWLLRNVPAKGHVFLNNCQPGRNPLVGCRSVEVNGHRLNLRRALSDLPSRTAAAGDGATLLISYEDTLPGEGPRDRPVSGDLDEALIDRDVLIYRGFLNWAASLLKKMQGNDGYSLVRRNAVLLRAVDTYGRVLARAAAGRMATICYDDWCASDAYRADVLTRLGFPLRDNSMGAVQGYGGGSSFQKSAGTPEELDTGARWRQMADDPEYRAVLTLCAQDRALLAQLETVFPQDARHLRALTGGGAP